MCHFMHTTILTLLAALSVNARPSLLQSYGLPQTGGNNIAVSNPTGSTTNQGTGGSAVLGTSSGRPCTGEEVHNAIGECVLPEISRNIFVYAAPNVITDSGPAPNIPKPEVHYNLVFVKTADLGQQNQPIIVPPPQQKTLVYVLSKKQLQGGNNVIHAPYNPAASPEVFYVNYGQGDNPQLPGGVDLQTALSSAFTQGQNLNSPQFPATSTGQNQGINFVGTGQTQGTNFAGTGQYQGNNFVGNVINGPTVSGGIVSPAINSPPIDGGIIDGGVVSGGIIDSGFGVSLGQIQVDSGFGQGGFGQQPGSTVVINSPTNGFGQGGFGQGGHSQQGALVDPGFGGGISPGQVQIDSGFGQGGFGQQPGSTAVIHSPTNGQGGFFGPDLSQYPTQSIPLSPTQGGQFSLPQGSVNLSPSSPSRPDQLYGTPN